MDFYVITKATVNEYKYNFEYNLPSIDAPRELLDVDKDKKAEIELDFYETGITLYAEIRDKSLNIDYHHQNIMIFLICLILWKKKMIISLCSI